MNSRATNDWGQPLAIAITRATLDREFLERRLVTRHPIPISVGNFKGSGIPDVALTLGEVAPEIYKFSVPTRAVAWSIDFKSHRHVGIQGTVGAARKATQRSQNAPIVAQGSTALQNVPTGFNYLAIHIPIPDVPRFRILPAGFGVHDIIGDQPTAKETLERWWTTVFGGPRQ